MGLFMKRGGATYGPPFFLSACRLRRASRAVKLGRGTCPRPSGGLPCGYNLTVKKAWQQISA
jgi:hypothetical protein